MAKVMIGGKRYNPGYAQELAILSPDRQQVVLKKILRRLWTKIGGREGDSFVVVEDLAKDDYNTAMLMLNKMGGAYTVAGVFGNRHDFEQ